jgi:GT2 family glycosyltransferase
MIRTAIVLINYCKEHELIQFVETYLHSQLNASRRLLVVDNGSEGSILKDALCHVPYITLFTPKSNLGYFGASRYALEMLVEDSGYPEFFVVSNFDLEFDQENFLDMLESKCSQINAAVIGPDIHSSLSGVALNPMYPCRLSTAKIRMLFFVTSFYPCFLFYQWLHYLKRKMNVFAGQNTTPAGSVYAVHGSFMIFRHIYFEKGGSMNFESFLYGEELFVAEECRRIGQEIYYEPSLKMIHKEHATTGVYKNARHMRWLHQSIKFIRDKYYAT